MLVLQAGKPDPVFAPRWAEHGAVGWAELLVVLLRLFEPPGLRAGPSAHPGSAQPEPDRIGAVNGCCASAARRAARAEAFRSGGSQLALL